MKEHRPKKLLDQARDAIRLKHYSYRTEQAYVGWIKCHIYFHDVRHPSEMGGPEVQAFLTHLAVEGNVAASTQNPCAACPACPEVSRGERSRGERSEVRPSARCSFSAARCFTRIWAPLTPCAGYTLRR